MPEPIHADATPVPKPPSRTQKKKDTRRRSYTAEQKEARNAIEMQPNELGELRGLETAICSTVCMLRAMLRQL